MIRAEIRNLERLGPLPTDDDDYPGIDRELLDFELLLAAIDPPITMEEARVLASLFPEDGSTSYGLAWSLVHLIGTLSINEYKKVIPDISSEEWRRDFDLSCTGWGGLCFRVGFFVGMVGVGWSFWGTKVAVGSGG